MAIARSEIARRGEGDEGPQSKGKPSLIEYRGRLLRQFCGTLEYLAPEILLQMPYEGFAADIWSAGIVLYAAAYGWLVVFRKN